MMTTYPIGYGTEMVTFDQLVARHGLRMHPEYRRRLFNWIAAQGGRVGIGGGFRTTQPTRPGFAPDGQSFHQAQTFRSGFVGYAAVDLVVARPGAVHRSPTWAEVPAQGTANAAKWGVHCNVSGEPWHMQCVEMDGWGGWVNAGRHDPKAGYPIPETTPPTPPTEPPTGPQPPEVRTAPVSTGDLPIIREGSTGGGAKWMQQLLNDFEAKMGRDRPLAEDGQFGPHSAAVLRLTQARMGIEADAIAGPQTYAKLFAHLAY
jgi:peptidoglycan hydrolase-like protein with peptidoglycan-binding domain